MPTYLSPGVYVQEVSSGSKPIEGVGTAVAAFVGLTEKGPANTPTLVTNWTQFSTLFGDFVEGSYLAHAVYGYFLNGGGSAYVVRVASDGDSAAPSAQAELGAKDEPGRPVYRITAAEGGPAGDEISVEIGDPGDGGEESFKVTVSRGGKVEETFDNVTTKRGPTNAATVVKARSKLIRLEEVGTGGAVTLPEKANVKLSGGTAVTQVRVTADDYVGNSADRTGFAGLEAVDEITMLSVPDVMAAYQRGIIDLEAVQAVQLAMIAHCELMGDRVAILDAPPALNAQQVKEWRQDKAGYDSKYAALYWPWIRVFDPLKGQGMLVPPSGHMAGIWARNDDTRGVHKAPANEVVRGAISLELQITKGEHDQLNPSGINCIRAFPGRGVRVWGARTISSDPEWRYLNVRRLFNYVEESILEGTQWVVFEPNDSRLWDAVKRNVSAFLRRVWRDGALFGTSAGEAFFVKCDAENNTQDTIDIGQLIIDVGIAPVKPAEFVIFRIAQFAGGAAVSE
jgi:phage tail sheath protein FI